MSLLLVLVCIAFAWLINISYALYFHRDIWLYILMSLCYSEGLALGAFAWWIGGR